MFDLLIAHGTLIDGSGAPRRRADVGVRDGRIAEIGDLCGRAAARTIDATGRVVAPGFIDSHSHDDKLLLQHPLSHPKLLQGVTTVVAGNCGISLAPLHRGADDPPPPPLDILQGPFEFPRFADYVAALRDTSPAVNAALLVGHSTLRVGAVADLQREATDDEIDRMRAALAEALDAGAFGLSTGVFYGPARAATARELIAVGAPLARGRGIVAMHIRNEAAGIDEAMREAFAVAGALDCPLVLSHHKLMGVAQHGGSVRTLAAIEAAARGQPVCLDCYPYDASSTMLLPARVADSRDVRITWSAVEPAAAGRSLREMAAERGLDAAELAARLSPGGAIYFAMSEADVERILAHPLTMVGSDGLPGPGVQHPRLWGTFPRVLGDYVRERGVLSLETAVHKMTGLTARRFGMAGRGSVGPGHAADLTVFDPATVRDRATYDEPALAPAGIEHVVVNGRVAVEHGEAVDLHAGAVLRRQAV